MKAFYSLMALILTCFALAFCVALAQNFFYPMAYSDQIELASEQSGVPSSLIASVALAESSFRPDSVSKRGAVGLMQLMPSTAQWICAKNGIKYDENRLFEPEYNLRLGAHYLGYLLQRFGNTNLALCAYNAGPATVNEWLESNVITSSCRTQDIPYAETRNYLSRVNKNLYFYKNKYK